jgi:queuine tRNA-ribosyltransferase
MMSASFSLLKTDERSRARAGVLQTTRGAIQTPVFMPVGTRGAVKALTQQHLLELDAPIILGNTYHLMLRPGKEIIAAAGGLHAFSNWPRPILTDSGGFQVFSLSQLSKITEEGVTFQSHIDGARHFLGPQQSMEIQKILGSDIVMAFDECAPYPCSEEKVVAAMERTHRWARQCRDYSLQPHQALFGIVQGGVFEELRRQSCAALQKMDFEGYAIGGLSVGEPASEMYRILDTVPALLPETKPRYLMGVGTPRNLIEAVRRGVDMFDCVMPTRNARNGTAFTWSGKVHIKAGRYRDDFSPLDPQLNCYTSQFSKAYLRHLLNVEELTGYTLITIQNVAFYLDFMRQLRQSILDSTLDSFYEKVCALYPD